MTESQEKEQLTASRDKYDLDFRDIHEQVYPADVRPGDRVLARVRKRLPGKPEYLSCQVWKLSPLGIELVDPDTKEFVKGTSVDVEITVAGERSYFEGLIVDKVQENRHIRLLGIRLAKRTSTAHRNDDRRRSPRWLCSEDFFPSAVAPGKVGIHDSMRFQIRDISKQGLQLTCSLRNKFLLPGMSLTLAATFPEVGQLVLRVRVIRVNLSSEGGRDVDSLEELRNNGFEPHSVSKGVDFYFLKTEEDYRQVLELRLLAHQSEGTIRDDNITAADLGDINDARARILIGKYRGNVIVTGRVRFNDLSTPLEHEKYFDLPKDFPRRDQIQEVSRLCTHPDFRRGDLLACFFQFICSSSLSDDSPYYLMGSWEQMIPFYEKIGFRKTTLSHEESLWNQPQTIMIGNAIDAMLGRTTDPIYWNIIWREASDHAINNGVIIPTKMDRVRLRALKLLGPIATLLFWYRKRPRKAVLIGS
jgi:hypothetical protein